jgi:hypothetical protein
MSEEKLKTKYKYPPIKNVDKPNLGEQEVYPSIYWASQITDKVNEVIDRINLLTRIK